MDEQNVGIVGWFKNHSTILFIVIVGLVAGVAFLKRNPNSATTTTASGIDTTGLQTDSAGNPIVYRDVGDTFVNVAVNPNDTQPVASAPSTTTTGGPVEHPIEPGTTSSSSSSNGGTSTSNSFTSSNGNTPTDGLLGPHVQFVPPSSYKDQSGTVKPIPLPSGTVYKPGGQGRMWYVTPGSKLAYLLTSGDGGPVTNSPQPA